MGKSKKRSEIRGATAARVNVVDPRGQPLGLDGVGSASELAGRLTPLLHLRLGAIPSICIRQQSHSIAFA